MNGPTSPAVADDKRCDVFLSYKYDPAAEQAAKEIDAKLTSHGLNCFLGRRDLRAGLPWRPEVARILSSCRAVVVLCGPGKLGRVQRHEADIALERQDNEEGFPVIPVLLEGGEPGLEFLMLNTWVDYRVDPDAAIATLVQAILRNTLDLELQKKSDATRASICPYRGLSYFREEDAPLFFGRSRAVYGYSVEGKKVAGLIDLVAERNFIAVVGPSGSGKSSVVRAGLIPVLRKDAKTSWEIITVMPRNDPLKELARVLLPYLEPSLTEIDRIDQMSTLAIRLNDPEKPRYLADVVQRVVEKQKGDRLLIAVDQWEELYTGPDPVAGRRFIDQLLNATTHAPLTVVITMQDNFLGKAIAYRPLCDAFQGAQFNLGPMNREELEQAIRRTPAEKSGRSKLGVQFEPGLVPRLLDDAGDEPGNLPLLEFVLEGLWNARVDETLLHDAYDKMGGLRGAIAKKADEIYDKVASSGQTAIRRLFLQLVHRVEGEKFTRQRAALSDEVVQSAGVLVKRLVEERLLVTSKSPDGEETVEIAHGALVENWGRLKQWLKDAQDLFEGRERLRGAMNQWQQAIASNNVETCRDALLRGALLKEADVWREKHKDQISGPERTFIDASIAERDRLLRLRIWINSASALFAVILATAATLGWVNAEKQRKVALAQTQKAVAARLISEAKRQSADGNLQHAAMLAAESLRRIASANADETLRQTLKLLPRAITNLIHGQPVASVAFSPQGAYLITASGDTAQLWIVSNGVHQGRAVKTGSKVYTVAFSPDGRRFATGGADKSARMWETDTGLPVGPPLPHGGGVAQVAFAPDGQSLATIDYQKVIRIWSTNSANSILFIKTNAASLKAMAFAPTTRILAVGDDAGFVQGWDVVSGDQVWKNSFSRPVRSIAFDSRGELFATAGADGENLAQVWTLPNGSTRPALRATFRHQQDVVAVAFGPDGKQLATAGHDSSARLWDVQTGQEIVRMLHTNPVVSVSFSPDGKRVATGGEDGMAGIWETTGYSEFRRVDLVGECTAMAVHPDAGSFAVSSDRGIAHVFGISTTNEWRSTPLKGRIRSMTYSPDGRFLAAGLTNLASVWALPNRQPVSFPQAVEVAAVAFSKDSRLLAIGCVDGLVSVVDRQSAQIVWSTNYSKSVQAVAFSTKLNMLAVAGADDLARILDFDTRREICSFNHANSVNAVCFSPDGLLATVATDPMVRIWDTITASTNPVAQFSLGVECAGLAVAFSHDGKYLAAGSSDYTVRVWDWRKASEIVRVGHEREIVSVAFTSDGYYLATASRDGSARLWHWQPQQLFDEMQFHLTQRLTTNQWREYIGLDEFQNVRDGLWNPQ